MPRKNRPVNPFGGPVDPQAKKAQEQKRNKRRSDIPGTRPLTRRPELTADLADQFVKLMAAGIPAIDCLIYFAPEHYNAIDDDQRAKWLTEWTNAKLVIRALNLFNGGSWESLEKDQRIELALDKALASLAYFLYTHDYAHCLGSDLKKHDAARKDIMEYLKVKGGGEAKAPWMQAMEDIINGTTHVGAPPVLTIVPPALKGN